MNPAIDNDQNFIAMPAIGNAAVSMTGTLDVSSVIYPLNGQTTTFMNPGISAAEVMANIPERSRIGADVNLTVLATGFKAFKGYNTIAINARAGVEAQLPRSIFSMLKQGVTNNSYDISTLRANADAFIELSLGHSHALGKKWRIGGNLKFLLGAAHADAELHQATLNLQKSDWVVTSDADINASVKGLTYKTKLNDRTNHQYVNGAKVDGTGLNGFGLAVDLGTTFQAGRDWTLSLAFLDLGFISWNNNMRASTCGPQTFYTSAYTFNVDDDRPNSFSKEWDKIKDDLSALYELNDMGNAGSRTKALGATMNVGIQYTIPRYRKLNFALLNTTRIQGAYTWTDFRLSANISPVKCLDGSVNMSVGTFGVGFGWLLNLHTKGFGFFLGMDRTLGKVTKQFVPLNSNGSVSLGMNFPF